MTPYKNARFAIPALASILYFSQGFPNGIITQTVNVYLTFAGATLPAIGLIGSVGVIWSLKVFWAPVVDAVGTYRAWIFGALVVLIAGTAILGLPAPAGTAFVAILVILAIASATQDIAIDALAIRVTPANLLGPVNSARVAAYRVAWLVAGGGIGTVAARIGWEQAFYVAAAVPLVMLVLIALTTPRERAGERERHENPLRALVDWLKRPGAFWLVAVIFLYRMGDNTMQQMIAPFWKAQGYGVSETSNVLAYLGMICTIIGAIAGGAFVTRVGVYRSLVVLGIVQMLSNLGYAGVAYTEAGRPFMYGAAIIEAFCNGLGTAAFLSFLMFICDKSNAATEYAMLSALFGLGRTVAFSISGYLAEPLGFANYYALTAALAIPGLALLPLIRSRLQHAPSDLR